MCSAGRVHTNERTKYCRANKNINPVALIEETYDNCIMNEEEVLEMIECLKAYLRDNDAIITEAIECALYDLEELLK